MHESVSYRLSMRNRCENRAAAPFWVGIWVSISFEMKQTSLPFHARKFHSDIRLGRNRNWVQRGVCKLNVFKFKAFTSDWSANMRWRRLTIVPECHFLVLNYLSARVQNIHKQCDVFRRAQMERRSSEYRNGHDSRHSLPSRTRGACSFPRCF